MPREPKIDMALDTDGNPLSYSPAKVRQMTEAMLADPETKVVVMILRNGDELVGMLGEAPSEEVLSMLDASVASYKRVLKTTKRGHA